ncbi:general transcription factor IIH subunit 3 isoform X2 [Zootermopsis nevadensis]|uniref:General transcription factor IIH subunit 3 n=1 Tax=Zootermopsis nevadensis TaxID=136037 RepID=A0A067RSA9_ZOONE|nr:general transcription factor IIH subunit 3 isoform X2 [Zootermopsis nevadensis]KDR22694.1 General transcription factor IIH subunit 3 [Zootermopsis nevadensis]
MNEEVEASLLVIVLDTNPGQRLVRERTHILTQCLESVIAFANSHLMLKSTNKLAVLACHTRSTEFLFPPPSACGTQVAMLRQQDGQYELFTHVEKTIRQNLQQLVIRDARSGPIGSVCESLLAGALAMALCYIHRLEQELSAGRKMNSRILVVTGSADSASQYMSYMNVFFTAQKQNVTLDVCSLDRDMGLLQQGCDITGGLYLRIPQLQGLLQYLLWVFLPEPTIRKQLVLPPPVKVDYRAACFCHRELIDIGYVCSVCLSIFCKFSPICTTCHTVFKTPGPLPTKSKKKKIKLS